MGVQLSRASCGRGCDRTRRLQGSPAPKAARIAGLRDALLVLDRSALPRRRREPGIGGDLPAIIEVPEQPFRVEDGGTLGADTLEIEQCRCWSFGDFDCQQSVALGLHLFDLGYHQFESVELATDLPFQMFWHRAAVAGPQFLKPMSPVTSQRLVAGDALSKQQALDAVDMAGPLTNQNLALTADAAAVLLLMPGTLTIAHTRGSPRL